MRNGYHVTNTGAEIIAPAFGADRRGAQPEPPPSPAGHNSGSSSFDAIVAENLRRGLYRSQLAALIATICDPRTTKRHHVVLATVIKFMSATSGVAFPGWRAIAAKAAMFPGDVPDPEGAYGDGTIRNLLSDLQRWGYLTSVRRGPEGGGRAIAHYSIAEPPYDKLRAEITKWVEARRRAQDP